MLEESEKKKKRTQPQTATMLSTQIRLDGHVSTQNSIRKISTRM